MNLCSVLCTRNGYLIWSLPNPCLRPSVDINSSLPPGSAVRGAHCEVSVSVLVHVPETGQGEPKPSLGVFSVPDVPLAEGVLK